MFRIVRVRRYDYDEWKELGLNMALFDFIRPAGPHSCDLLSDECFIWNCDGSLEDLVEFLGTEHKSFPEWLREREPAKQQNKPAKQP